MTLPEDEIPEETKRDLVAPFEWRRGDIVVISEGEDESDSKEEPDGTQ